MHVCIFAFVGVPEGVCVSVCLYLSASLSVRMPGHTNQHGGEFCSGHTSQNMGVFVLATHPPIGWYRFWSHHPKRGCICVCLRRIKLMYTGPKSVFFLTADISRSPYRLIWNQIHSWSIPEPPGRREGALPSSSVWLDADREIIRDEEKDSVLGIAYRL